MEKTGQTTYVYPIIFTFNEVVEAVGFKAAVNVRGRAIAVFEDGEWWLHGVEPGGLSESGDSLDEAGKSFNRGFREFLEDAAFGSGSFDDFERQVREIFHQKDDFDDKRWHRAVDEIRLVEQVDPKSFANTARLPAEAELFVDILRLDQTAKTADSRSRVEMAFPTAA